jgi:hypothetical protein
VLIERPPVVVPAVEKVSPTVVLFAAGVVAAVGVAPAGSVSPAAAAGWLLSLAIQYAKATPIPIRQDTPTTATMNLAARPERRPWPIEREAARTLTSAP